MPVKKRLFSISFFSLLLLAFLALYFILLKNEIVSEFRFLLFKKNGWSYLSATKNECVLREESFPRIAHIEKAYSIENPLRKCKITLCREEETGKIIVFLENIEQNKINDFISDYHPDIVHLIHGK